MATTPTISDVARLAGVSVGTVSHVLRGKVRVSENLTQRVHEAAAALGYAVDPAAQALRLGYQNIVGVGLLGARKKVEQAACTFLLPFARELRQYGMEALVLSPAHSPVKDLCLEDFTELVIRAKRSHLHSLLICLSTEFSSCTPINAEAYVAGMHTDKHRLFPIAQSTSATRALPIFEVHLNTHGTRTLHGEGKTASLEWRPLRVGTDSAEGHCLTRGNIADCIAAIMDSRGTTRVVG
ncbi:LacI family DNA-binding transcriptional regulator [Actinomyces sp.]